MRWITGCVLAVLSAAGSVSGEEYRPGDKIVVVVDGNLTVSGQKIVDNVWPGLVLTVGDVNGEWLWLSNGKPGYLSRDKVIPLNRPAIDRLTELVKANPTSAALYSGRAAVWQQLGELDIAMGDYNEAIRLDPTAAAYHNNRGTAWRAKQELDKAIADHSEALRLDPKYASAYNGRGNAWYSQREYHKAIADYDEALRLDPKDAMAYFNRGNAWHAKQDYDKAITDYNDALRLDPKDAMAYNNRGIVWGAKQDYDKAIADYNEALRLDPKYVRAYHSRGLAWGAKQEYDKAIVDYSEALRLDPKDAKAYFNRGLARLALREKTALDDYEQVLQVEGRKGSRSPYAVILGHLTARLLGDEPRAKQFLVDHAGQLPTAWPTPTVTFLRGELDEAGYMALADTNDKQTEAHCFLGMKSLAEQQIEPATTHFQWVRDHGNKEYVEYRIAIAELKRLEQKSP